MRSPERYSAFLPDAFIRTAVVAALASTAALGGPGEAAAQAADTLPFGVGERMVYRARVAGIGTVGRGAMWIEGPEPVRGVQTWLLRFDMRAGFGPVKAFDRTSSWLDAARMTSLRYAKREQSPVTDHREAVDLYPEEMVWRSAAGDSGATPTARSLDELSFIYYIRTLPLAPGAHFSFDRHFDRSRNPTTVTVPRRERITTAAGTFRTLLVEMRVRDSRRYKGVGVISINVTDDRCRIPVRITSTMRVLGTVVLALESYEGPGSACAATPWAGARGPWNGTLR